jgi:hypothetical protein
MTGPVDKDELAGRKARGDRRETAKWSDGDCESVLSETVHAVEISARGWAEALGASEIFDREQRFSGTQEHELDEFLPIRTNHSSAALIPSRNE